MATSRELQSLLRQIQATRSPVQRLKLVSLAWRTVQRLSADERSELGRQLGVRGFGHILEKLGVKQGGIAPAEVLQVLDQAEDLDPSKLGRLVRRLRDPGRRQELLRKGIRILHEQLDDDEPEEDDEPEAGRDREAVDEAVKMAEPKTPVERTVETGATAPVEEPEPAAREAPRVGVTSSPVPPSPEIAGPVRPVPPVPTVAPAAPPAETASRPTRGAAPTPPAVSPVPGPAEPDDDDDAGLVERLEAAPSLVARFRLLRATLDPGHRLGAAGVRAMLECFPHGWPRRRALAAALEADQPEDLDDALELIEGLERETDRRWCAAVLLGRRDLAEDEARRVVARIPCAALRMRLRALSARTEDG